MLNLKQSIVMGLTFFRLFSCFYLPLAFVSGALVDAIWYKIGLVLAIAAGLSDMEGGLARWWKCESEWGAWWDVCADKISCWTLSGIGWAICGLDPRFVPMFLFIMIYDGIGWDLRRMAVVEKVCFAGKVKTYFLFAGLIMMVWRPSGWLSWMSIESIAYWLMYAASFFAVCSIGHYLDLWDDIPDPRPVITHYKRKLVAWIRIPAI